MGGAQLALNLPAVTGNSSQQVGSGRGGHRHDAMGAADLAAAQMDGRDHDPVRLQQVNGQADAGDIGHCVQRAHLVEVDL